MMGTIGIYPRKIFLPRSRLVSCLLAITFAILTGCSLHGRRGVPPELNQPGALIPVVQSIEEPKPVDAEVMASLAKRLNFEADPANAHARSTKALVLSGGGMFGAYTVGVLKGWTATGTRPQFDVVTGISTGGLIATYAFLGSEYDQRLADLYTSVSTKDIYRRRSIFAFLWSDALASSTPFKQRVDAEIDDQVIQAVAAAHAAGRRLYVGTTNVDTGRLVIWDMGAIASSGRPDAKQLYRKILLATSAVPGFLPPVPIDVEINGQHFTELHVDGGAMTSVFLRASELNVDQKAIKEGRRPLVDSDAYVIIAGKLYSPPKYAESKAFRIAARSLDALVASHTRGEIFRIYTLCMLSGARFHLTSLPDDFQSRVPIYKFDQAEMRRLLEAGYQQALSGRGWRSEAPMSDPAEVAPPRSGNEFIAPGAIMP
ncbi:MAG: patatin-like phospholipase family protein [Planctomycetes bacterium]|nr:patatin-like phospholipase family protein [Planctomycetota bacterium]